MKDRFEITDALGRVLGVSDNLDQAYGLAQVWASHIEVWVIDTVHGWSLYRLGGAK